MNEEKKIDCPYAEKWCSRELAECIKRHFIDNYPKIGSYLEIEEEFFCEDVDEMLERYYALCAKGYRKQAWISVEEALPEREGYYLGYTYKGVIFISPFFSYYENGDKAQFRYDITHWMPLPEPPKGGEHE